MIPLAFRLARQDLRGGLRGLRVVVACLALGVGAIAAVGTLRAAIEAGLAVDGRRILGGDLAIEGGAQPLPDALRDWLRTRGARFSDAVTLRSMVVNATSGERMLVELKAVDTAWPLVGEASFSPVAASLAPDEAAAEPLVLDRLGLKPGDMVRLGTATLRLIAKVIAEPDKVGGPSILGPRLLVRLGTPQRAGLLAPGAIAEHHLRLLLPAGVSGTAFAREIREAFPDTGWRIRDPRQAAPGVTQFIDQTALFMTLVGLTSLLVGGIGVANGVRAWLEGRSRNMAVLRCVGAPPRLVFTVSAIEVAALAALGVGFGLVLGVVLPALGVQWAGGALPVPPRIDIFPVPLALAAGFGLLTAATFALWPLSRALRISGAMLLRERSLAADDGRRPPPWLIAANGAVAVTLVALIVAAADQPGFAGAFCAAACATLLVFRLGAAALTVGAKRVQTSYAWARLGLANLHRPGAPTALLLLSVGIGLSTLATVAMVEGNIRREVVEQLPTAAPSFFFVDIQPTQLERFRKLVRETPGVTEVSDVPSLRARIVAVDGVPAERVAASQDTAWALRGDRGLTIAGTMPEGTRLAAGSWWPAGYMANPLVSFDATLARGWGVKVGSVLRVNVLGRDIDLEVANLRDVQWRTLGINFTLIASPGLLSSAPYTHIATVRAAPEAQASLLRRVTDAFPNVSGVRVTDVLNAVATLLGKLSAALAALGSLTLATGALVLAGSVASGQRRRTLEAVTLKALGATRSQIRAAWLAEFGALGVAAGVLAGAVATVASWAVMHYALHADWAWQPARLLLTLAGCVLFMLVLGHAGTESALRAKAARWLRHE